MAANLRLGAAVRGALGGRRHAGAAAGVECLAGAEVQLADVEFKGIPILPGAAPGERREIHTPQGFTAIKDGIKRIPRPQRSHEARQRAGMRKPPWLRAPMASGPGIRLSVKKIVREHRLSTVCEEAKCPNIGECWNAGTATIMLMGAVCTRACRFCAVDTGNPRGWLDAEEPENVARSVELMGLKYVVLTSVNRDDLPDGGAAHYAAAIRAIKRLQSRHCRRGADAGFPRRDGRCAHRARFRVGCVRAERGDGAALDAPGARSARRL
jgi:hypothetical protein